MRVYWYRVPVAINLDHGSDVRIEREYVVSGPHREDAMRDARLIAEGEFPEASSCVAKTTRRIGKSEALRELTRRAK